MCNLLRIPIQRKVERERPGRGMRQKGEERGVRKRSGSSSVLRRVCCGETRSLVPAAGVKVIHSSSATWQPRLVHLRRWGANARGAYQTVA